MGYQEGASIGYIGYECLDQTTFIGTETFCSKDGTILDVVKNFTCPDIVPHCIQCGEPSWGAALCLSTDITPTYCRKNKKKMKKKSGSNKKKNKKKKSKKKKNKKKGE